MALQIFELTVVCIVGLNNFSLTMHTTLSRRQKLIDTFQQSFDFKAEQTSPINAFFINDVLMAVTRIYVELVTSSTKENRREGSQRKATGDTVERMAQIIISSICERLKIVPDIRLGQQGKVVLTNVFGSQAFNYDVHWFINGECVLIIEAKAYLDKAMLHRAEHVARQYRTVSNTKAVVFSLERATDDDTSNFALGEGDIDRIFYLTNGMRLSNRPLWNVEYSKPLRSDILRSFIDYCMNIGLEKVDGK